MERPPLRVPYLREGRWGVADRDGVLLVPAEYESVSLLGDGLLEIRRDGLRGVVDHRGDVRLAPRWRSLSYRGGLFFVTDESGEESILDLCDQALPTRDFASFSVTGDAFLVSLGDAETTRSWALLDRSGAPLIDWGSVPIRDPGDGTYRRDVDGGEGEWVYGRDGERWFRHQRSELVFYGTHFVGLSTGADAGEPSKVIYDRQGALVFDASPFLEMRLARRQAPSRLRLDVRSASGWGLIELVPGDPPKTLLEPRYPEVALEWYINEHERARVSDDGEVERFPRSVRQATSLPEDCGEKVQWRYVRPNRGHPRYEYLNAAGDVLESSTDEAIERWQIIRRGEHVGVRDVCTEKIVVRPRYFRVFRCIAGPGESRPERFLGLRGGHLDLWDVGAEKPQLLARLEGEGALCSSHGVEYAEGATIGVVDLDGREVVPPRVHRVVELENDGRLLYLVDYFGQRLYIGADGRQFFDTWPTPGEFPETAERRLRPAELRRRDRAELERMRDEILSRYAELDLRLPMYTSLVHEPSPRGRSRFNGTRYFGLIGPIERANIEAIARELDRRPRAAGGAPRLRP